ncbi:MAG: amidohydrolase family protein, partial [Gemmatimonadota bacterium]
MYEDIPVLDVHGHVSVPQSANSLLVFMMGSNTPAASPIGRPPAGPFAVPEEDFRAAAQRHVDYLDERAIDVQVIGPRPFLTMGWMEEHLIPAWARYVNDMIHQQCTSFPDRFLGACQLPQVSGAPDLSSCLDELNRCVSEYGFVAAYVSPDPAGQRTTPGMHEPYWYPLYERCEELAIPNQVVVPADSPATTLADLRGKVVSTSIGSAAHGMLATGLSDAGMSPSEVKLLGQDPPVGAAALTGGQAAALAQFVPWPQAL